MQGFARKKSKNKERKMQRTGLKTRHYKFKTRKTKG